MYKNGRLVCEACGKPADKDFSQGSSDWCAYCGTVETIQDELEPELLRELDMLMGKYMRKGCKGDWVECIFNDYVIGARVIAYTHQIERVRKELKQN